jgi:hypothetical protein
MGQPQKRQARTTSVAAPLGGWNARDSVAEMNPMDATVLENFFPTPSDVSLRKGYTQHATGITGQVETLMSYNGSASEKLFAIAGGKIFDVTNTGTATQVFTGLSNSKWQFVSVSTVGGQFLAMVNGLDPAMVYNGTNWIVVASTTTAQTISTINRGGTGNLTATVTTAAPHNLVTGNQIVVTGASPAEYNGTFIITRINSTQFSYIMLTAPATNATVVGTYSITLAVTGVDSATFVNINLFKNRLWFVQEDSLKAWYLDPLSIGGTAEALDLGGIARNGGFLQAMGTWTLDAGEGADDYAVFVTSMGEVMVYNGTDPSVAETWLLKGVWQFGQTFARRCFFKWAGDLLLLTQDGLVPLSGALQSSRLDPRIYLTDKIFYALSQAASLYYDNFGWQIDYFAGENMLILNVPISNGTQQFVMHGITKSWGQFTGINANCWEVHGKEGMYFGSNGYVGRFYNSTSDNGTNIKANCQQAYSYFDSRGTLKRFTMVRPIIITDNALPTVLAGISTDFDPVSPNAAVTFNPALIPIGEWDSGIWDYNLWGGGVNVNKQWQGVTGIGYSGGINLSVASQGVDFRWASTDYVFETGGVL